MPKEIITQSKTMGILIRKITQASATVLVANLLAILLAKLSPISAASQVATLYGSNGETVTFSGRNSPDLRTEHFDKITVGAQTQGKWILYKDYNYYGELEIITNTYKSLDDEFHGKASSIRFVGSSDNYEESTITLYQGIYFQGKEFYTAKDTSLDGRASSLIITGSDPWTLYFEGDSICVNPKEVYDTNDIGIPHNGIRSVRLGCFE